MLTENFCLNLLYKFFSRILLLISFFVNFQFSLLSQTYIEVLTINSGGAPIFLFDTPAEIATTGITYNGFIRIGIRFEYRDAGNVLTSDTWKLSVGASTPDLSGSIGSIPLDRIELRVVSITAGQATISPGANVFFPLTVGYRDILQAGINDIITAEVVLDIRVGFPPNTLSGYPPDFYLGFIDFVLDHE